MRYNRESYHFVVESSHRWDGREEEAPMLEQSIRCLAEGDVTVSAIVTALSSWEYGSSCELIQRPSNQLYYILEGERTYHPLTEGRADFLTGPRDLILMPSGLSLIHILGRQRPAGLLQ